MMSWNGLFFHNPSSFSMEVISLIHDYVIIFIFSILVLVIFSLVSLFFQKNFDLSYYENHQVEFSWTVIPFVILSIIIIPSLSSLYMLDSCIFCGYPLVITGHQWYWSYFIPFSMELYDSYMLPKDFQGVNLMEVDNCLSVPMGVPIRCSVSSSDVIHSWTVPSLGVKMDAVPGRLNNFCFLLKRPGVFFGQCSEICGANHSFMPINLEGVSINDF